MYVLALYSCQHQVKLQIEDLQFECDALSYVCVCALLTNIQNVSNKNMQLGGRVQRLGTGSHALHHVT